MHVRLGASIVHIFWKLEHRLGFVRAYCAGIARRHRKYSLHTAQNLRRTLLKFYCGFATIRLGAAARRPLSFPTACDKLLSMSVRMRHTRSHTRNRRSHHALASTNVVTDKETGNLRLPHRLDEKSGTYRGMQIVTKKEVKKKEKVSKSEKSKGANTTPEAMKHEKKESKGLLGKMSFGNAKSRSGLGAEG